MNFTEKIKSDKILNTIIENFHNEIYLVGGAVRDFFMGIDSHDRDLIVIDEDAKEFSLRVAKLFDAVYVPLDEENKIYRIVMPNKIDYLDITNPIGSLEKDLMRRDLTINALAISLRNGDLIDICGGLTDIKNKTINYILDNNFVDDPLRLLRIYRFQAIYGFDISVDTVEAVCKYAKLIKKPSVERVNYELLRMFGGKYADIALTNMDKACLLQEIFPFVAELKKVPPNSHHHLDLFNHSIETVKQIQIIYENSDSNVKEHMDSVDFGGHSRLAHIKMAAFMHDIGKFSTWTIEENGRHRFIKHDDIGAKIAQKFLKEMHFSNKQINYICQMIKNHIYPSSVMSSPQITDKIMMRYLRKMDRNCVDNIILAKADRLSARGPEITEQIVRQNIDSLNKLLDFCLNNIEILKPIPILLNGNDVMKLLNIAPSPELGAIMNALHEAQISGDVLTLEHAREFVISYKAKNF